MNAVLDDDNLLELILFQLDGEVSGILTRCADGGGPGNLGTLPQIARRAHAAALTCRLVCRRWKAHSEAAIVNAGIRFRFARFQTFASFFDNFLTSDAMRRSRRAAPSFPTVSELMTPSAFLVKAYEHSMKRVAGTNPDAAVRLLRHLQEKAVRGHFVIYAAHHKLASWQRRLRQQLPGATISVYGTEDDLRSMKHGQEFAVVSYALASTEAYIQHPGVTVYHLNHVKYVIFDDARRYMWRPNLHHIFYPTSNHVSGEGLLLDDFHTRPCTLAELCTLAVLAYQGPKNPEDDEADGVHLQAHLMQVFDPFNFSEAVVDRLLRPQLMDALRHGMCRPH